MSKQGLVWERVNKLLEKLRSVNYKMDEKFDMIRISLDDLKIIVEKAVCALHYFFFFAEKDLMSMHHNPTLSLNRKQVMMYRIK